MDSAGLKRSSPFTAAMRMASRAMSRRLFSSDVMRSSKREATKKQSGQRKTPE